MLGMPRYAFQLSDSILVVGKLFSFLNYYNGTGAMWSALLYNNNSEKKQAYRTCTPCKKYMTLGIQMSTRGKMVNKCRGSQWHDMFNMQIENKTHRLHNQKMHLPQNMRGQYRIQRCSVKAVCWHCQLEKGNLEDILFLI